MTIKRNVGMGGASSDSKRAWLEMPTGCNVIIVGVCKDSGIEPRLLLLPHQLSERILAELEAEVAGYWHGRVVVIPASSANYITVSEVDHSLMSAPETEEVPDAD